MHCLILVLDVKDDYNALIRLLICHLFSAQMYTPLHAAASSGQISVVRLLLEYSVEVDAVNTYGNTPLHIACLNGQDVVVSKLLEYSANPNSVNNKGMVRIVSRIFNPLRSNQYFFMDQKCKELLKQLLIN